MVQTFCYTNYQNWKVVLHYVTPISLFGSLCHADRTIKGKFTYKENFLIRRISFFKKSKIGFLNFKILALLTQMVHRIISPMLIGHSNSRFSIWSHLKRHCFLKKNMCNFIGNLSLSLSYYYLYTILYLLSIL
jgi:hypothetical protein